MLTDCERQEHQHDARRDVCHSHDDHPPVSLVGGIRLAHPGAPHLAQRLRRHDAPRDEAPERRRRNLGLVRRHHVLEDADAHVCQGAPDGEHLPGVRGHLDRDGHELDDEGDEGGETVPEPLDQGLEEEQGADEPADKDDRVGNGGGAGGEGVGAVVLGPEPT